MPKPGTGDIMTTFLLFVSFLLNVICLFAIVILYTRQNRLVDMERRQGKMIEEMEETISAYLIEMKEENEAFIDNLHQRKSSGVPQKAGHEVHSGDGPVDAEPVSPTNKRMNAAKAYKNNSQGGVVDPDQGWTPILPEALEEETFISQVLNLHENGLSIEDIAKKLGKGKTEIELLIKFNQKSQ
jgi:hypothetical protein